MLVFIEFSFLTIMTVATLIVLAFNIFLLVGLLFSARRFDFEDVCLGVVHLIQILGLAMLLGLWIVKIYKMLGV